MKNSTSLQSIKKKIQALATKNISELVQVRRHLHQHPELSFQEIKTSKFIAQKLKEFNIPFKSGYVKTGIVAIIKGKNPAKKVIALRADMDALPIIEANNVSYCSKNKGVMHACGHDVHSASLLGTAKILQELRNEFEGTIKLIFQPGDEVLPGGASLMIQEGVLKNPIPKSIYGQHVFPSMEAGTVGFKKGMYMASTDELYLTVTGKGGHAAMPAEYINPIIIASEILLALNAEFMTYKSNKTAIPTVLAFGKVSANGATNVIPEKIAIEGTFRTMDEKWRKAAHIKMKKIASDIAKKRGGACIFEVRKGYPFLVNDESLTTRSIAYAIDYLGKNNVEELPLRMTAEDFAYYSQVMPACFYRLGTANKKKGITSGVHTPTFDIDEKALLVSSGLMAWMAINELSA